MLLILVQNQVFWELAVMFQSILSKKYVNDKILLIKSIDDSMLNDHLFFIFGANVYDGKLPKNYILVQLEQSIESRWFDNKYLDAIRGAMAVLDYSFKNYQTLKHLNKNYYCFTIGYDKLVSDRGRALSTSDLVVKTDSHQVDSIDRQGQDQGSQERDRPQSRQERKYEYDVIHMGQVNLRRKKILDSLTASGLKVKILEGCWGDDLSLIHI